MQAVAESMVIYDVKQPTDESLRLAQILAEQADELLPRWRSSTR